MDTSNSTRGNERLRQERVRRNWRQRDLAEQLGTTVVTIKRWERGYQQPSSYFRDKLREIFGKDIEELGFAPNAEPEDTGLWSIPFPRNPFFTGRDLVLQQLHTALTSKPTIAPLTQSYALQGLGGIGKTQLAIEYTYRYRSEYQAIFWVEAETQTSLMSSFLRLATLLELPETAAKDQRKIVAAVLRWLNRYEEWLLIFDNVEALSLIKPFLPASDQGALLLTTRLQTLGTLAKAIPLSPMTTQEGIHFLLRRTKRTERERALVSGDAEEKAATQAIVAEMGGLPLALEQAGAYIDATQCRLSDYLHLFRAAQHRLLDEHEGSSDHPLSVNQTFVLAFERVEQRNPLAAALLKVCAFLAPDAIPETLFLEGASLCGSALEAMKTDSLAFPEAIKVLLSYSFIQRYPETQSLSIHRLVQAVLRQRMNEAEQERWRQQALHLLAAAFPKGTHKIWKQCERLLPHVLTCVTLIPEHCEDLELSNLLQKVSIYLAERGLQYEQVETLCQRALHIHTQLLGLRHPKMADFLYVQGRLYRYMGKYEESESFYRQALHIYAHHLGAERPEVARVLGGLAHLFWAWGKYQEAEQLQKRALSILQQVLEPGHSETTQALSRLALIYQTQGKYEQAIPIYEQVLSTYERGGSKEPNEAVTLNNLADLYQNQGRYEEAELLSQRVLHLYVQTGGPEHPNVAAALHNLADLLSLQKKYEEAQPLYKQALRLWKQTLGPEHPNIAFALNGMANLFRDQGEHRKARLFYHGALTIRQRHLGPHHPDLAETLHDMAYCYYLQRETTEALGCYQQALDIREQAYGSEHPKTQATRSRLARLSQELGQAQEAIYREV